MSFLCHRFLSTGSSWTTTGTIGIVLMAIGKAYGFSDGMIAGAIISGAYFGDKMSPLVTPLTLFGNGGLIIYSHPAHALHHSSAISIALLDFHLKLHS